MFFPFSDFQILLLQRLFYVSIKYKVEICLRPMQLRDVYETTENNLFVYFPNKHTEYGSTSNISHGNYQGSFFVCFVLAAMF